MPSRTRGGSKLRGEQRLAVGTGIEVEGVVIRPIAQRRLLAGGEGTPRLAFGQLEPVGVLVEGPEGRQMLDLEGARLPDDVIDELEDVGGSASSSSPSSQA